MSTILPRQPSPHAMPPAGATASWLSPPGAVRPPKRPWYRRLLPVTLGVLGTGLLLYFLVYAALVNTGDPLYIPALILVGASTVPAAFAVYVSRMTGPTRVSAGMLAMATLWGGVLGAVIAGVLESDSARLFGSLPTPIIGIIEESAKLLVPLAVLVFVKRVRRSEADGLLIGVAVGVTFAVLETMGYAFVTLLQSRGNLQVMDQLLLIRGLLAPAGHAAWTGLAAAALWQVNIRRTIRSALVFLATFATVVTLHAIWDSTSNWWWYLALATISLGLLHLRLWRIRHNATNATDAADAALPNAPVASQSVAPWPGLVPTAR
jgi:RsiW-degrading membrane proteinase PrsW (M82 family)